MHCATRPARTGQRYNLGYVNTSIAFRRAYHLSFQIEISKTSPALHGMHIRFRRPLPAPLPEEIKHSTKRTPEHHKAHIEHNRRDISSLLSPGSDELAKPITPQILVDRDCHEDRAGHWFVAVDGIRTGDRRKRHNLNPGTRITDNYNYLHYLLVRI